MVAHLKTLFFNFAAEKSFKQNILESICECSISYSKLLCFSYKIKSSYFSLREEYSIRFHEGNFLHLTGVKTKLSPNDFFKKAITKELTVNDFDCDSTHSLKGTVREKIKNLKHIDSFFEECVCVQEKFERGKVFCLVASSNGKFTLGFTGGINLSPMTLLNKNQIKAEMAIVDFEVEKKKI